MCTHNEIQNSTGHHRIISYHFGDLEIIIRHETDAYVAENAATDLTQLISQLALSSAESADSLSRPAGSAMTLMNQGRLVPREATLEIKTRGQRNPLAVADVAAQLWISQTPKLVRAHHDRGFFPIPMVEDVTSEIAQWEKDHQSKLEVLAAVIRKIRDITKQCSGRKASVKYDKIADRLTVLAGGNRDMLPEDLYRKWDAHPEPKDEEEIRVNDSTEVSKESDHKSPDCTSENPSIVIGGTMYKDLPLHKLPALATWLADERAKKPTISTFEHDEIPLFPVAVAAINSGWRQIFRLLDTGDVNQFITLCSTFTFLGIDVLEGKTLDQVLIDIKAGKNKDYWDEERNGDRSLARDAAFQLVCLLLQDHMGTHAGDIEPDSNRANKFYNAALYIAGHLRTFKYKTRRMVQIVYLHCQSPSAKQQANLAKWSSDRDADEPDATTSAESDLDDDLFGSDFGYDS